MPAGPVTVIVPGDLVEMNVFFAELADLDYPMTKEEKVGLVIAVKQSNVDDRFKFDHVYYVWSQDHVVGPLFRAELRKL